MFYEMLCQRADSYDNDVQDGHDPEIGSHVETLVSDALKMIEESSSYTDYLMKIKSIRMLLPENDYRAATIEGVLEINDLGEYCLSARIEYEGAGTSQLTIILKPRDERLISELDRQRFQDCMLCEWSLLASNDYNPICPDVDSYGNCRYDLGVRPDNQVPKLVEKAFGNTVRALSSMFELWEELS